MSVQCDMYGRMDVELTAGVLCRITTDRIQLMRRSEHHRSWWQFWKPKTTLVSTLLAEKPHTPHVGDQMRLSGTPDACILTVNGKTVLDWPIHQPSSMGWGINSGLPGVAPALQSRFTA